MQLLIRFRNLTGIESGRGEVIGWSVQALVENFAGLLSDRPANVGVDSDTRLVSSVARDDRGLFTDGQLQNSMVSKWGLQRRKFILR